MMEAVWYEQKGAPHEVLQFGHMRLPEAGPGEVLIKVFASAVNPSDIKGRTVWSGTAMPFERIVPHQDAAGVIADVGEGADPARIGQRVWCYQAQWNRPFGSAAQWMTLPAARAVLLPDGVSFAEGACLGIPAMTAHRAVALHAGVLGRRVLVQGGAGAVGFYAVQWAKLSGAALVAASVRNASVADVVRAAGADAVMDLSVTSLEDATRVWFGDEQTFERIVEVNLGANIESDIRVLISGGEIVSYASDSDWRPSLPMLAMMTKNITLSPILVFTMGETAIGSAIDAIDKALRAGSLQHRIAHVLPLDRAADAHALQESGRAGGKIILAPWGIDAAEQREGAA